MKKEKVTEETTMTETEIPMSLSAYDQVKGRYGFDKRDSKWLAEGSEFLQHIGSEMVMVEYKKEEDNSWSHIVVPVSIIGIGEYESVGMSYELKYSKIDEEGVIRSVRIQPDGFSIAPDSEGNLIRIIPFSLHYKLMEAEMFWSKLETLYKRPTLPVDILDTIANSKDSEVILNYSCQIMAIIKTVNNEYLWFRISKLELSSLISDTKSLKIYDRDSYRFTVTTSLEDDEYPCIFDGTTVGTMKIIDLQDPKC